VGRRFCQKFNNGYDLQAFLDSTFEEEGEELLFSLSLKQYSDYEIELINKAIDKARGQGKKVYIEVGNKNLRLADQDVYNIIGLKEDNIDVVEDIWVYDNGYKIQLEQVVDAYANANEILKNLKQMDLSPFEKLLIVQNYVTSRLYTENEKDSSASRSIYKVLTGQDIVCVGYSALMQYMLKELGVTSYTVRSTIRDEKGDKLGGHQSLVVVLRDKKYGVYGCYYMDATWDSHKQGEEPFLKYNFTLVPLKDKEFSRKRVIDVEEGLNSPFVYSMFSEEAVQDVKGYIMACETPGELKTYAQKCGLSNTLKSYVYNKEDVELNSRREWAIGKVVQKLKDKGLDKVYINNLLIAEMVACYICNEDDEAFIDETIDLIPECTSERSSLLYSSVQELKDFKNQKDWSLGQDIDFVYQKRMLANWVVGFKHEVVDKAVDVSLETFRKGIVAINVAQGSSVKEAKRQADKAIEYSVKRSEKVFKEGASNCFRKEALKRRKDKQK